jgi:hypothetical protein
MLTFADMAAPDAQFDEATELGSATKKSKNRSKPGALVTSFAMRFSQDELESVGDPAQRESTISVCRRDRSRITFGKSTRA